MNTILTIIRKELKDSLRDRKTLISAVLMPALAVPLLILGITKLQQRLNDKERNKQLKVVLYNAPAALQSLFTDPKIQLINNIPLNQAKDSVSAESYDAILDFAPGFEKSIDSLQAGTLSFYFKSTNEIVEKRINEKLELYKSAILSARFSKLNLSQGMLKPLDVHTMDVASTKEQIGVLLGGFIPYFFILFCYLGCMYPAIDMLTGEKEKGTIETLLTVPASRFSILMGKMIAIAIIGVCAAIMTMSGMFMVVRLSNGIPPEILKAISDILSVKFILMLFAMLIPLSIFFAGILSAVAIRASTFKEAQSYVTPMSFVVIIPAVIALMPGMKLTWETSWIPILNIALATKEIVSGTIKNLQYLLIVFSLIAFAGIAVLLSIRQFSNEKNILK